MTTQEAIEKMKWELKGVELAVEEKSKFFDDLRERYRGCITAFKMSIEALEMQVPKKPVKDQWDHDCCPTCGYAGIYKDEWGGRYIPHCENCGQAIDWEGIVDDSI